MHLTRHFSPHSIRRGFTLIELLVVVLILSILLAIALPLYLQAVADSQKKTCRSNMQTIATAVEAARVKANPPVSDYSSIIAGGVSTTNLPDLTAVPLCPTGGIYTLDFGASGAVGGSFKVICSSPGHGSFEPGVNSN